MLLLLINIFPGCSLLLLYFTMISLITFLVVVSLLLAVTTPLDGKSPVVLVPGTLGSQIKAKLNKKSSPHFYCSKKKDWYTLWMGYEIVFPPADDCWQDNAKLVFNSNTQEYQNNYGVETTIPGFGQTDTIEHLDELKIVHYFHGMVEYLKGLGYIPGKSVRGAPYDWRHAADGQVKNGYYNALQLLIEETYAMNNNTPVTVIAHSLGGLITHFFFSRFVQEDWKQTYIKQYISLSGVFGGCVKALKGLISGSVEGIFTANVHILRDFARTLPSVVWMTPHVSLWGDEVIVSSYQRNYTANDIMTLFNDLNYANGTRMYKELQDVRANDFKAPNVTHHCFYGSKVLDTVDKLIYGKEFANQKYPDYEHGDGDGTCNIRSLMSCNKWKDDNKAFGVHLQEFEGVSHYDLLSDENVLNAIKQLILD